MQKKGNLVLGGILIAVGAILLLARLDVLDFRKIISNYWAFLFIIIPGLLFHYGFWAWGKKEPGLLVPGGILLVIGITLQLSYSFELWDILWPGYILAVAFGLFELYLYGSRDKGLLVAASILGGLSLIFFISFSLGGILGSGLRKIILPCILIALGLIVISGKGSHSTGESDG